MPTFPAWDQDGDVHTGLVATSPSVEYLERAWDDAKYGRMSEHPYIEVVFPTAHEPEGLAPKGKHLMLGFSQYGPYELAEGSGGAASCSPEGSGSGTSISTKPTRCPAATASTIPRTATPTAS